MKKIVFFTMSLTKGGAERVISNMCNEYFSGKYQVSIITCMCAPIEYSINPEITIHTLDRQLDDYKQSMGKRFLRRRSSLKRVIVELKPDIIISFLPEPNFLCLSLKHKLKLPMIISVRNDPVVEYGSKLKKGMMKYFYPQADGYVFQTQLAKQYFNFSKHISERGQVIPNPLSNLFLQDFPQQKKRKLIINVGRLENQKNQVGLIKAFSRLGAPFQEYTLEIFGEGSLKGILEQKIIDYNLVDRVFLRDNVDHLYQELLGASLFVLSSIYEGMPNALMEAMALGLPVISTDCPCGGPGTLIKSGNNGILVPVGNEDELVKAMERVLLDSDYAQKIGNKAKEIKIDFNPQQIFTLWDNYIKDIYDHVKENK